MHARLKDYAHQTVIALLCALAMVAAGCHNNNRTSGFGQLWVTLTDDPGDYTSYIITVDSLTLTRSDGAVITAVGTPVRIDFAQLDHVAELWGTAPVPNGTYVAATITLDYTNATVAVMMNGTPQTATLVDDTTAKAPTTYAVTMKLDPSNPLTITPTYASTSAARFAVDFNLAASGRVSLASTPTVHVRPFLTAGVVTADTKLIRVRGPLVNTSTDVSSYSVYVRPFYDEANNVGTVTLFNSAGTVYSINGNTYIGTAGLHALSLLSAGTTMTAGYTQFETDFNPANNAHAGRFNLVYVIGASTLEDLYTEGLTGDVMARNGNKLTLLGSTLILNTVNTYSYEVKPTEVLVGPGTIVTADDNTTLTGLNAGSIAVGQRIVVRGIYSVAADGTVVLDATGTSSTNTGSVRLLSTELWGSLVSSGTGSLVMSVQTINNWPVSDYNFAGNGASTPNPAAFTVSTGTLGPPAGTAVGNMLWVHGFVAPFGSAPPEFKAVAVNNEATVQLAGTPVGGGTAVPAGPGTQGCGAGSQVCDPASLRVMWSPGSTAPFEGSSPSGFSINLNSASLTSAVIRIGPESIDLKSLPASPLVMPTTLPATTTFAPQFAYGNPVTASTVGGTTATTSLMAFSSFASFLSGLNGALSATTPASQLEARGVYNRLSNTFTATRIDFVL